jgi:hypothetical protein
MEERKYEEIGDRQISEAVLHVEQVISGRIREGEQWTLA